MFSTFGLLGRRRLGRRGLGRLDLLHLGLGGSGLGGSGGFSTLGGSGSLGFSAILSSAGLGGSGLGFSTGLGGWRLGLDDLRRLRHFRCRWRLGGLGRRRLARLLGDLCLLRLLFLDADLGCGRFLGDRLELDHHRLGLDRRMAEEIEVHDRRQDGERHARPPTGSPACASPHFERSGRTSIACTPVLTTCVARAPHQACSSACSPSRPSWRKPESITTPMTSIMRPYWIDLSPRMNTR